MTVLTDLVVPWASLVGIVAIAFGVGKWVSSSRGKDERHSEKLDAHAVKIDKLDDAREAHGQRISTIEGRLPPA